MRDKDLYTQILGIKSPWQISSVAPPCENLLDNAADDCESSISREDPDTIYSGDGSNCRRRKTLHGIIRDTYNPILRDVLDEYRTSGQLPNARYTDIYMLCGLNRST